MALIPSIAAGEIACKYGYDQVIIIGRKRESGEDSCAVFGINGQNYVAAKKIADIIMHNVLGWKKRA